MRFRDDDMPYAHVVLAVEGCGWINPDYFPLMIGSAVSIIIKCDISEYSLFCFARLLVAGTDLKVGVITWLTDWPRLS